MNNKLQRYLRNRRTKTNIRVMIEISRNYNTFIKVTQLKLTRQQFYNMTEQQRFNLLYDVIGSIEWGSIYNELCWTLLFIGLILLLVFGIVVIGDLVLVHHSHNNIIIIYMYILTSTWLDLVEV